MDEPVPDFWSGNPVRAGAPGVNLMPRVLAPKVATSVAEVSDCTWS